MVKLSVALAGLLAASASAFAPSMEGRSTTALKKTWTGFEETGGEMWDPMGFYELGSGEAFDTFPNMFPDKQFLEEAEIKHGRQAMLAWTGVWATAPGPFGLGLKFPGMPDADWTTAFGAVAKEQPALFGTILLFIFIAEGESVGHSGDNFRGKSTKEPGFSNYDPLGLTKKLSPERLAHYKIIEKKNGRAAMIAMASLFAFKAIPGSVPIMDLLGAQ